jgi:hypothetical protein
MRSPTKKVIDLVNVSGINHLDVAYQPVVKVVAAEE